MHKLQNYSMQSHRSLVINKGGDITDSFLSEQSVRDVLLLDRLVLSWLTVRHESLSEALSDTQRAVHRSYQDFQQLNVTIWKMRIDYVLSVKLSDLLHCIHLV